MLTLYLSFSAPRQQQANLTTTVTGLRSGKGSCIIYLYHRENGFPTKPGLAFKTANALIENGMSHITLTGLEPGNYAVAVLHDENSNGKMDVNFIGMPKEGIGTSNNAKSTFGPPGFEDSRIRIGRLDSSISIRIKYL